MPHAISMGNGMERIAELMEKGGLLTKAKKRGKWKKVSLLETYLTKALSLIEQKELKEHRVVVDAANGMTGPIWKRLGKLLPITVIPLYFDVDGTFPNHEPDPLKPENRKAAEEAVRRNRADLGFAFDADGDRLFVIDESGKTLPAEFVTALLSEFFLAREKGGTVIYDVRSSWVIRDVVSKFGGKAVVERVGHAYIKKTMEKTKAVFGGEVSGHFYFRDFFCSDSGTVAALVVLNILSKKGKPLSSLVSSWRKKYFLSGERNFVVPKTKELFRTLKERYRNGAVSELDGVSVELKDWHMNVRSSNTEPLVRLTVEALSKRLLNKKREELTEIIKRFG
jgi:phosphomannomutase